MKRGRGHFSNPGEGKEQRTCLGNMVDSDEKRELAIRLVVLSSKIRLSSRIVTLTDSLPDDKSLPPKYL